MDRGPYGFVRHPGYAGAVIASLALPFMLNALWTLIPSMATILALIVRTKLEDKMLMDELEGYKTYATKTTNRLIPGVW